MSKPRVLFDTMIFIEATRLGILEELCQRFAVETVQTCFVETQNGNLGRSDYIPIDSAWLKKHLANLHLVPKQGQLELLIDDPRSRALDPGERDLLSFMRGARMRDSDEFEFACADRAALYCAARIKILPQATSLERLAEKIGVPKSKLSRMNSWYTEKWLNSIRAEVIQGRHL